MKRRKRSFISFDIRLQAKKQIYCALLEENQCEIFDNVTMLKREEREEEVE